MKETEPIEVFMWMAYIGIIVYVCIDILKNYPLTESIRLIITFICLIYVYMKFKGRIYNYLIKRADKKTKELLKSDKKKGSR